MKESLIISADLQNWGRIYDFITQYFLKYNVSKKSFFGMLVSAEEIFSNIIHHAKVADKSNIVICIDYEDADRLMTVDFNYGGIEFNPSEAEIPDVKVSLNERRMGGLGLLIVKRFTDSITYRYSCGKNILQISKKAVDF